MPKTKISLRALAAALSAAAWLAACSGGGRAVGEHCGIVSDCADDLQCLDHTCVPACHHHVDCGDGMTCESGECVAVSSAVNDPCASELQCGAGQTCRLNPNLSTNVGSCQDETAGQFPGEACKLDKDCYSGTCALGRCVDLCSQDEDCVRGAACAAIPRLNAESSGVLFDFKACLPTTGTVAFEMRLPPRVVEPHVMIPVPSTARSMVLVTMVDDPSMLVGGTLLNSPTGRHLYTLPQDRESYYRNAVRHEPMPGVSALAVPDSADTALESGAYEFRMASFQLGGGQVSRTLSLFVVEKLGPGAELDLHFFFADLAQHPCEARFGGVLDKRNAMNVPEFRDDYVEELRQIFGRANVALGDVTLDDISELAPPSTIANLATLNSSNAGNLFKLNHYDSGVAVFIVRSISPIGVQVITSGTPGVPLPGTRGSGVAISLDSLCYRDWKTLARQTAHAVSRQLGLFRNREPDGGEDPIEDSPPNADNLMHYSEFGGTSLSTGQRAILRSSPALR